MFKIEKELEDLDEHLELTGVYDSGESYAEALSKANVDEWKQKLESALSDDFQENLQIKLTCLESHFQLFSDQGATVWSTRCAVVDNSTASQLIFWFKAVLGHKNYKVIAEENLFRMERYEGSNEKCKLFFERLKPSNAFGFGSALRIVELFKEC